MATPLTMALSKETLWHSWQLFFGCCLFCCCFLKFYPCFFERKKRQLCFLAAPKGALVPAPPCPSEVHLAELPLPELAADGEVAERPGAAPLLRGRGGPGGPPKEGRWGRTAHWWGTPRKGGGGPGTFGHTGSEASLSKLLIKGVFLFSENSPS